MVIDLVLDSMLVLDLLFHLFDLNSLNSRLAYQALRHSTFS